MTKIITLALLDFNAKQQAQFSAILVLSEMSLNDDWQIVDKEIANIIFVNSEQTMSQKQWDEIQLNYPKAILVAYSENLESLNIAWKLLTESTKPPQRSLLIALLSKIAVTLNEVTKVVEKDVITVKTVENNAIPIEKNSQKKGADSIISKEISSKEPLINEPVFIVNPPEKKSADKVILSEKIIQKNKHVNDKYFLPEHYFLGIVQKSIQTGEIYHCKTLCNINIYLFPKENSYFCSLNIADLKRLFLMSPDEIKIKKISEKDLKQYTENMETSVLTDLLWHSAVTASQGRLMKNHHNDIVHLKYWPDISYINTSKNYLGIAIFMQHNAVDIIKIAGYTEQKESDVIDFHNACNALGLIDYNKKFFLNSKPSSDQLRQLRQRIFKTLRLNIAS